LKGRTTNKFSRWPWGGGWGEGLGTKIKLTERIKDERRKGGLHGGAELPKGNSGGGQNKKGRVEKRPLVK